MAEGARVSDEDVYYVIGVLGVMVALLWAVYEMAAYLVGY